MAGQEGTREVGKDGMPESQLLKEPSNDGRFRFMEPAIEAGSRLRAAPSFKKPVHCLWVDRLAAPYLHTAK